MRYVSYILQILAALYIAKYASISVLGGKYIYIVLLFVGTVLFLLSSWKQKFIGFSLMIFFPVLMPRQFPLPMKTVVELLAPLLCLISIVELMKRREPLFPQKISIFFIALIVMVMLVVTHYILNPVFGRLTFGSSISGGGLKSYFLIVAGMSTFLCSYWFFLNNELNAKRCFSVLLVLCLIVGNLYVISLFTPLPILNNLNFGGTNVTRAGFQYSSLPLRVMNALGTCLLISFFHNTKWGFYALFILFNTIVFLVFGGGRSSLPTVLLPIFLYITVISKKYITPVLLILVMLSGMYVLFMSNVDLSEYKFGRAFKFEGGLEEQDEARYYSFLYMYDVFKRSPIIGKGIGFEEITGQEEFFKEYPAALRYKLYMQFQLMSGGHGSYLSILSIFGIFGLFWLFSMLLGGIYHAYRFVKMNDSASNQDTIIALFVFLQLLTLAVAFVAGGHGGYDNMRFWYLAGTIAGLTAKSRSGREIELSNNIKLSSSGL